MNDTVFSFLRTGLIAAFLVLPCGASGTLAQAADDRPTMVVAEVRNLTNSSQITQLRLSENVQRDLESAIGATRRFRILERDAVNLGTAFAEQELENSELSNSDNARSGHVIAAGYIVVPSITRFELGASFTPLEAFPGQYSRQDYARLEIELRVLDAESSELLFIVEKSGRYSRVTDVVEGRTGGPGASVVQTMAEGLARDLAQSVVDQVFPIMVAQIQARDVYLNRGGDAVRVGDQFDVYAQGPELVDPMTGEPLGGFGASVEFLVGRIEVSRVAPRFSIARVLSGDVADFEIGAIARRIE